MDKKKNTTQTITVKVNEENPEPMELIAKSIIEISDAFDKINKSSLSRRAIVLLLQDITKLGQRDINSILDAAPKLKSFYIKSLANGK